MPKRIFWIIILCLAIASFPSFHSFISFHQPSLALKVQQIPNPQQVYGGWVTDMADLLTPETEAKLNRIISRLERRNGTEIAIVTVPETSPADSPKQFATKLFNYWGIGKKGKDNGILFLISKKDKRVEIETGYGVEEILPDSLVGNIIDRQIIPYFKQDNFDRGTLVGTKNIISALTKFPTLNSINLHQISYFIQIAFFLIFALVFVVIILSWWGFIIFVIGASILTRIRQFILPDFVPPEGRYRIDNSSINKKLYCANCRQSMDKLDWHSIVSELSRSEQVAQQINSLRFEGWRCANCQKNLNVKGIHIRSYILNSNRFKTCPNCQELTLEKTSKILEKATSSKEGKRLINEKCNCCAYSNETIEVVPKISSSYSSSSGSSYSGGSSFSGSGSFGGGGSDGGGAGGSW